jgi:DNA-binding winged helix-turn-helix (wHTH) protein
MDKQSFILNNRFFVSPAGGIIRDAQTGHEEHVEPYQMRLLSLLAINNERLVSISDINTQLVSTAAEPGEHIKKAIARLGKVLIDGDKTLIERVQDKGFILHARVLYNDVGEDLAYVHGASRGRYLLIAAAVFLIAIVAFFIFKWKQGQDKAELKPVWPLHKLVAPDTTGMGGTDMRPDTVKPQRGADEVK